MDNRKLEPEEELFRMRERLWRIRGRRSRAAGTVLLTVSIISLLLAYATRYSVFEVMSITSLLVGVVLVFTSAETYIKARVANRAVASSFFALNRLLEKGYRQVKGKAVHIPPLKGKNESTFFLPISNEMLMPTLDEMAKGETLVVDKGLLLPSTGDQLLKLYEEDLGDLRNLAFDYLVEWLPRVLVEGLQAAESVKIAREGEEILVKITGSAFRYLCQHRETSKFCKMVGCPLCSSIADAIAKESNRIVHFQECSYDPLTRQNKALYKLGPILGRLKSGQLGQKDEGVDIDRKG